MMYPQRNVSLSYIRTQRKILMLYKLNRFSICHKNVLLLVFIMFIIVYQILSKYPNKKKKKQSIEKNKIYGLVTQRMEIHTFL